MKNNAQLLMPREKMLKFGISALTDVELLALFLRTGTRGKDVPRFYVSTSKSIIKALINMHSFEIQLSPIG
ncbi:TPA: hypothetical protein N6P19_005289 [Escherichia coli]|nr:hypothetical protein [Escherichia coli]HCN1746472.1 hypothetical protein [Escherichia coli]HCN4506818.1 hypothetical protein [Escherichia coli]HCN4510082.1 hypothetical protein [Escherichia coli]